MAITAHTEDSLKVPLLTKRRISGRQPEVTSDSGTGVEVVWSPLV